MVILSILMIMSIVAAACVPLMRACLVLVTVAGHSMEPELRDGDRVLAVRPWLRAVRRGDVVVVRVPTGFTLPDRPGSRGVDQLLIKRVVTVGGDGHPGGGRVPPDAVFVVSDNGEHSLDSRAFGPVPARQVVGVVVARLPVGS